MIGNRGANSESFVVTTPSEVEIRMTRLFDAPRQLVFEAMTKPEHVKQWWGRLGDGYSVPGSQTYGVETLPQELIHAGLLARLGARHAGRVTPQTPYDFARDSLTLTLNATGIESSCRRYWSNDEAMVVRASLLNPSDGNHGRRARVAGPGEALRRSCDETCA